MFHLHLHPLSPSEVSFPGPLFSSLSSVSTRFAPLTRLHDSPPPLVARPPWASHAHRLCSASRHIHSRRQYPCQRSDGNVSSLTLFLSPLIDEQMFLGSSDKVYILDKVEGNPTQINGHSAFASVWSALPPPSFLFILNLEQGSEHAYRDAYRCPDESLLRCWHAPP